MIPIWGTVLILKTLFLSLDGILGDAAARLVTRGYYIPGLGNRCVGAADFSHRPLRREFHQAPCLLQQWENLLNRVPVVRDLFDDPVDDGYPVVRRRRPTVA
ncbi:MAG: hypothetical protein U0361_23020 [Nitrospiraceae bacterium]